MAFKFVAILAFVSIANAGLLPAAQVYHAAPALVKAAPLAVAQPVLAKAVDEYDPHPQYNFAYDIQDALSGDSKSQIESRDGDVVRGQYSLIDADGFKRTVDYTADPLNGFNAVVSREPLAVKAVGPAIVNAAPVAYAAAPGYLKASPISYAAAPAIVKTAPIAYAHH